MKRSFAAIAAAIAALAGLVILEPSDALALPTGCQLATTTGAVSAYCSSGDGYYRAAGKKKCGSYYYYVYGSWRRPGGWSESYVNAGSGCYFVAGYLQKKS